MSARDFYTQPGFHSSTNAGTEYWEVTLAEPIILTKIVYYNRGDCCSDRALGYVLTLIDNINNVINTIPFTSYDKIITFNINNTTTLAPTTTLGP
jgi:hypothetical protein